MADKFYNVISKELILSAANVETAIDIDLPCDWRTKTMVLIHRIEFQTSNSPVITEADGTLWQAANLNWSDQTGVGYIAGEDVMANFKEFITSAVGNAELVAVVTKNGHKSWQFKIPIPVAQSKLHFCGNTTGLVGAQAFAIRIYFTTKQVSDKDWQEVMEARHGYTD